MPIPSPKAGFIVLATLLAVSACRDSAGPQGAAIGIGAVQRPDAWQTGQIFNDRIGKGLYGPEMVVIGAGEFMLGAHKRDKQAQASEKPAHAVRFADAFAISRTEISVADFARFVRMSGYRSVAEKRGNSKVYDLASGRMVAGAGVDWRHDHLGKPARADNPVVHVAHDDAVAYTAWLSERSGKVYRLPSEAEWEYVLRAGADTVFPWGNKAKQVDKGNLGGERDVFPNGRSLRNAVPGYGDGHWGLAPVRRYSSEGYGSFDMLGNVAEWVEDCWHENYRRAPASGEAWVNPGCRQRVVRGSSWLDSVAQSRASFRMPADADDSSALLGFRVVRGR